MTLKSIGVFSCAKVLGSIYAAIGLVVGGFFALFALLGSGMAMGGEETGAGFFGLIFGAGAVVLLPLFYGTLGFIAGAFVAFVYNAVAGITGGLELDLE